MRIEGVFYELLIIVVIIKTIYGRIEWRKNH